MTTSTKVKRAPRPPTGPKDATPIPMMGQARSPGIPPNGRTTQGRTYMGRNDEWNHYKSSVR